MLPKSVWNMRHRPWAEGTNLSLWQHTEALLYGFQSIAETIDVNYSDVVPGLIGLIPHISISNVQLADTVMFTIGEETEHGEMKREVWRE